MSPPLASQAMELPSVARNDDNARNVRQHEAGWGTDHPGIGSCKFHGGSTPNHRTAAALVATDAEARATLAR